MSWRHEHRSSPSPLTFYSFRGSFICTIGLSPTKPRHVRRRSPPSRIHILLLTKRAWLKPQSEAVSVCHPRDRVRQSTHFVAFETIQTKTDAKVFQSRRHVEHSAQGWCFGNWRVVHAGWRCMYPRRSHLFSIERPLHDFPHIASVCWRRRNC